MNRTFEHWTRQSHRWLSIVFTVTVAANFVARAMAPGEPPPWITYSPLPPLFLQLFSGLYLFALPYFRKRPAVPAQSTVRR
jgi:cellulose synthase/poly-beta-1,6-N-acetylglucosamine synthase-like glycosyltransferase